MTSSNMEYSFVEPLPRELSCVICMNVLQHPQMVNCCEKLFCERCLRKWSSSHHSCPCCRSDKFSHMEMQTTARKIGTLQVNCPHSSHGCQVTPALKDYHLHLSKENPDGCLYVVVSCPNGCGMEDVFRRDLERHCSTDCPKRQAECPHCREKGWHAYIKGEHQNECSLYPISCPLNCGAKVPRIELASHPNVCSMEVVACPFEESGCTKKMHRKELDDHLSNNLVFHLLLLTTSQVKLRDSMTSMEERHKRECKELKERNLAIENKLSKAGSLVQSLRSKPPDIDLRLGQLETLLKDQTMMDIGSSIALELAQLNIQGSHFVVVQSIKFQLTWAYKKNYLEFQLFLVEPLSMPATMTCDFVVKIEPHQEGLGQHVKAASILRMLAVICCGKSQTNNDLDVTDTDRIALGPPKVVYVNTDISLTLTMQEHGQGSTPDDKKWQRRSLDVSSCSPIYICQCNCHTSHHRHVSEPSNRIKNKSRFRKDGSSN